MHLCKEQYLKPVLVARAPHVSFKERERREIKRDKERSGQNNSADTVNLLSGKNVKYLFM